MSEMLVKKCRIVQRADGLRLAWTPKLDARSDMHPGWLCEKTLENGSTVDVVVLDRAAARDLDNKPSQREAALIEEVARLRDLVAAGQSYPAPVTFPVADVAPIAFEDAPILEPEPEIAFAPENDVETPIAVEPEPKLAVKLSARRGH